MGILLTFQQAYQPVGDNLLLSALVAGLPLYLLFVMLPVLRLPAWICALAALPTPAGLARLRRRLPPPLTARAPPQGIPSPPIPLPPPRPPPTSPPNPH